MTLLLLLRAPLRVCDTRVDQLPYQGAAAATRAKNSELHAPGAGNLLRNARRRGNVVASCTVRRRAAVLSLSVSTAFT